MERCTRQDWKIQSPRKENLLYGRTSLGMTNFKILQAPGTMTWWFSSWRTTPALHFVTAKKICILLWPHFRKVVPQSRSFLRKRFKQLIAPLVHKLTLNHAPWGSTSATWGARLTQIYDRLFCLSGVFKILFTTGKFRRNVFPGRENHLRAQMHSCLSKWIFRENV